MDYKDTKLILFLKALTVDEINELEKYLSSPFFKQGRDPLPLLKILKKYHPEFDSEKFTEENVFNKLFPGQKYSDNRSRNNFRSVTSYLLKAVENFLSISSFMENKVLMNRLLLESLLDRNLLKYYDQYRAAAQKDIETQEKNSGREDTERILLGIADSRYHGVILDLNSYLKTLFENNDVIVLYSLLNLLRTAKTNYLSNARSEKKAIYKKTDEILSVLDMEKLLDIFKDHPRYVDLYFHYYNYKSLITDNDTEYYYKAKKMF